MAVHDLIIRIGAQVSPGFQAGIKRAFAGIEGLMGGAAGGALLGAPAALAGLAHQGLKDQAGISDMSKITGLDPVYLSKIGRAAEIAGVSMEALGSRIFMMQTKAANAPEKFERLGISVYNSNMELRDGGELFKETMDKLAGMKNITERNTAAQALFGKGAIDVIKVLDNYGEGMKYAQVTTKSASDAAEQYDENLNRIYANLKKRAEITGGFILKPLAEAGAKLTDIQPTGARDIAAMGGGAAAVRALDSSSGLRTLLSLGGADSIVRLLANNQKETAKTEVAATVRSIDASGGP
jgi:hypothetical protein